MDNQKLTFDLLPQEVRVLTEKLDNLTRFFSSRMRDQYQQSENKF